MKRNDFIDLLKGSLIILVVIGHVLTQIFPNDYIYRVDFKLIYSFHMFLFIFISGFLITYTNQKIDFNWIKKRFFRLMIPYFVWSLIFNIFLRHNYTIISYIEYILKPSFWYLIILFLCDCFIYGWSYVKMKFVNFDDKKYDVFYYFIISILTLIAYYLTNNVFKESEILKMLAIYIPYYFLGIYFGTNYTKVIKYKTNKVFNVIILAYLLSMFLYTFKDDSKFIQFFEFTHLPVSIIKITATFYNHFIVALLGTTSFILLIDKIKNIKFLNFIKNIGKYTLAIYILHPIFIIKIVDINIVNIIVSTVLGIVVPIIIYKLCKKINILGLLLFGEKIKNK